MEAIISLQVQIREAKSHEYEAFHAICDNDQPHPLTLEGRLLQRQKEFQGIDRSDRIILFAEISGKVVGCVQLRLAEETETEGRVHALVVHRPKRRRGIGHQLMVAVEELAHRLAYRRIWLTVHADNVPATNLYQSLGFVERLQGAEIQRDTITFEKQLSN